ncbi:hypothetical protein PYCCODRAFT_1469681 [Trametes coccinea BRFM310]|uniref:Uncharacterized protein n=1 Tax=Trametes coccinea (strain BRFM310) TaxID=1353009 RepID=A0A1Y2IG49_TRAC3|nr:hypothetical protein PYCCODRAFT_1469681 [Trametes coccinea BRFM310]
MTGGRGRLRSRVPTPDPSWLEPLLRGKGTKSWYLAYLAESSSTPVNPSSKSLCILHPSTVLSLSLHANRQMSAVATIDLRRALDIVEQTKAQNIDLAKNIYNATVQFMEAQGLTAREELWYNKMEELVNRMHFFESLTKSRQLLGAVEQVHNRGGFTGLHEKVTAAIAVQSEISGTFHSLLDVCQARVQELPPSQRQMLYDTLPVIHRILNRAKNAEMNVLRFLKVYRAAILFLNYVHDNFEAVSRPLRLTPFEDIPRMTRQNLDIIGTLLDEAASLVAETAEEAKCAVANLRSLRGRQLEQHVVDQKLTGLLGIRNKIIELQESTTNRFQSFSDALGSSNAVPTTLHGPVGVTFRIDALLKVASQYSHAYCLLEATHKFQEAQSMIKLLLQATSWSV